jgi:ketosteroid isomerase-like protein
VTPREASERLSNLVMSGQFDGMTDLCTADVIFEQPFAPLRLEGREQIREFTERASSRTLPKMEFRNVVVRETSDPDVIVVEWDTHFPDHDATIPNIRVLGVRNGLIAWCRDYHDHQALQRVLAAG